MKKITTVAAIALLGAIVLPSCKKDYKCTCTYSVSGASQSVTYDLNNLTKKDAKAACEGYNRTLATYAGINCNLD